MHSHVAYLRSYVLKVSHSSPEVNECPGAKFASGKIDEREVDTSAN
jgi:hypothetical protein